MGNIETKDRELIIDVISYFKGRSMKDIIGIAKKQPPFRDAIYSDDSSEISLESIYEYFSKEDG